MDREDILLKAEKLVRQGRLNLAITEYKRVVDDYPEDWATANTLGDMYLRAQQVDKAVEQYSRIADHLAQEGFLPKAAALYKKTLKIKPADEHALLQGADIALRQGLMAEAKQYFAQLVTHRRAQGNLAGVAEVLMRVAALDPDDLPARLTAARAVAEAGQLEVAAVEFVRVADELEAAGKTAEGIRVLEDALAAIPDDHNLTARITRVCAEAGEAARARQHARTIDDFRELVKIFRARGDDVAALDCLTDIVRLDSTDVEAAAQLVRDFLSRGHLTAAHQYVQQASQTNDPELLLTVGEVRLLAGEIDEAREILTRLLARAPHVLNDVVELGVRLTDRMPEGGLACVEAAASILLLKGDFAAAAQAYERVLTVQPSNLPALMCLVELCIEGGLDADLLSAQSRLVDAYLANDRPLEARAVAEDLATRTQEPEHIERFRRALVATGEPDPDRLIAERLGLAEEEPPVSAVLPTPPPESAPPAKQPAPAFDASPGMPVTVEVGLDDGPADIPEGKGPPQPPKPAHSDPFRLGPIAIDLGDILDDAFVGDSAGTSGPTIGPAESDVTEKPRKSRARRETAAPPPPKSPREQPAAATRPEEFSDFHEEVAKQSDAAIAEQHYKVGVTYRDMGMLAEAIAELELAVRSARFRFEAAALLARLSLQRGDTGSAIEWFERAAEAPAPSADAARGLLYELGDALEIGGESARALAVFLELHAEAGDYRDVGRRVERLSRVQAGG